VINFFDWPIEKAMEYEDCFRIVEEKVKPERDRLGLKQESSAQGYAKFWWQYARKGKELYQTISGMERVLVCTRVSKYLNISSVLSRTVYHDKVVVFAFEKPFEFGILQSAAHDCWAWKYSTTLGASTLSYSPTLAIETLPFPIPNPTVQKCISVLSDNYLQKRSDIMLKCNIGITKFYNLIHTNTKCENRTEDIVEFRNQIRELDNTVLTAYGWSDINLAHDFYEVDYLPENDRIRYTISPEARKEVLTRLLELNHKIHAEEVAAGLVDEKGKPIKKKSAPRLRSGTKKENVRKKISNNDTGALDLFGPGDHIKAVLFVEGPTDKLYIETAAQTCNRTDLLEGILIEIAGGAKQAREFAIQYEQTYGNKYELRALFDWDDSGKDAFTKLKAELQWASEKSGHIESGKP
jgi:hypothetical protein